LRVLKLSHNVPPAGARVRVPPPPAALLALVEAGGDNWPELEVLTLSGTWRGAGGGGGGAGGADGGGGAQARSSGGSGGSGSSSSSGGSARAASESGASAASLEGSAGAAAGVLALDAPQRLQRLRLSGAPRAAAPDGGGDCEAAAPRAPPGALDPTELLSPEARAALVAGPAPAARALIEAAADAWPGLRALELPALGRASLFEKEHAELEELAWRAAPRLAALNFGRHYHHL
jgi:hypothetical protein